MFLSFCFLAHLVCVALVTQPTVGGETLTIVDASNRFALDLYKKLIQRTDTDNVFISPVGISSALAMTLLGVKDNTAQQLKQVLHLLDLDQEKVKEHLSFKTLLNLLQTEEGAENILHISNRIFMDDDITAVSKFEESTLNFYGTVPQYVDFSAKKDAKERINEWARDETTTSFKDVIAPSQLDGNTKLALVSVTNFKGSWLNQFNKDMTRSFEFHHGPNTWIDCQIMLQHNCKYNLGFHEELEAQVLEMPLAGRKLRMMLVVPSKITGLINIESKLDYHHLKNLGKITKETTLDVFLPKLKLDESYSLKDVLQELGLHDLFASASADLSEMITSGKDASFEQVFHKVALEMDEGGSVSNTPPETTGPPTRFVANRPFFFYVEEVKSGAVVFMGRVRKPAVEGRPAATTRHDEL